MNKDLSGNMFSKSLLIVFICLNITLTITLKFPHGADLRVHTFIFPCSTSDALMFKKYVSVILQPT